jgi:hypothetical protein
MAEEIKVIVVGALGKMGIETAKAVHKDSELTLAGLVDIRAKGEKFSDLTGIKDLELQVENDLDKVIQDIKRVIGLPGETVEIQNGKVKIYNEANLDGFILDEKYYLASNVPTTGEIFQKLGPDEYYVLGDNRTASSDSRSWGVLNRRFVIGRAWVRAWPFDSFKVFQPFTYPQ